jgi:hypothetical protein
MSDVPVQVIVAAFSMPDGAGKVIADLKPGTKDGQSGIIATDDGVFVGDARLTDDQPADDGAGAPLAGDLDDEATKE